MQPGSMTGGELAGESFAVRSMQNVPNLASCAIHTTKCTQSFSVPQWVPPTRLGVLMVRSVSWSLHPTTSGVLLVLSARSCKEDFHPTTSRERAMRDAKVVQCVAREYAPPAPEGC